MSSTASIEYMHVIGDAEMALRDLRALTLEDPDSSETEKYHAKGI